MQQYDIMHNSHDSFYRSPFGAVPCGTEITLVLKTVGRVDAVYVKLLKEGGAAQELPMELEAVEIDKETYRILIKAPPEKGLLWYYFVIHREGQIVYYGNNKRLWGGVGEIFENSPLPYQITVYHPESTIPKWFKEAVLYQIFPDRFFNGSEDGQVLNPKENSFIYGSWDDKPMYIRDEEGKIKRWEFFGGNLMGIIKKLPYLKDLGINGIYLNPIFESPSNHRYDTSNYKKIDPMLGDHHTFKKLCQEARKLGIAIILDGVFSHTGSNSIYFNKDGGYDSVGAYQSKESPYYSWYRFEDYPHRYDSWWGIETMPNVNELEPSYLDYMIHNEESVLKYWMSMGIKGWRLDVVDEVPGDFVKAFKKAIIKIDPEAILIGEVWEDASNKISYGERREYLLGEELDSTMHYPLRKIMLDFFTGETEAAHTATAILNIFENYPPEHFYSTMNLIGSHDVSRVLTLLKEKTDHESALKLLKQLVIFQMTFPGVPCIYYGDEVGVEGGEDPLNRATFPWGKENKDLLDWYKQLIQLRHNHAVFKRGKLSFVYHEGDILVYRRHVEVDRGNSQGEKSMEDAFVLLNRNRYHGQRVKIFINQASSIELIDYFSMKRAIFLKEGYLELTLKPMEGKIFFSRIK